MGVYWGLNSPSWTLSCEAFFYLTFPFILARLAIAKSRLLWIALVTCAALKLAAYKFARMAMSPSFPHQWWTIIFLPVRIPEFIIGICIAILVKRGWNQSVG